MCGIILWINSVLGSNFTEKDLSLENVLNELISFSANNDQIIPENLQIRVTGFLESVFSFPIDNIIYWHNLHNSENSNEMYILALLVLLGCLQTNSAQLFIDAALKLDINAQNQIFRLIQAPMTCISNEQPLVRETLLSSLNFKSTTDPPTFDPDALEQTTPIKSASIMDLSETGRTDEDQVEKNRANSEVTFMTSTPLERSKEERNVKIKPSSPSRPTSLEIASNILMPPPQAPCKRNKPHHHSLSEDETSVRNQPAMSPLAGLKSLVESPLWHNKTRLRESERNARDLERELAHARAEREDVEMACAELRKETNTCHERLRLTESEMTKLRREAAGMLDLRDELEEAKSEGVLQAEEIKMLKQRVADSQSAVSRVRELEVIIRNQRNEIEDKDEKIASMLKKISESKERRILSAEIEALRWRLKETEGRLAQELADREAIETDRINQQLVVQQMRVDRLVAEKRRKQKEEHENTMATISHGTLMMRSPVQQPTPSNSQKQDTDAGSPSTGSFFDVSLVGPAPITPIRPEIASSGENLGTIFQHELESTRARIKTLENEMICVNQRAHESELEVHRYMQILSKLSSEVDSSQTALLAAEETASIASSALASLVDELATVEGRLTFSETDPTSLSKTLNASIQNIVSTPLSDLLSKIAQQAISIEEQAALATRLLDQLEGISEEKGRACDTLNKAEERIITLEMELKSHRLVTSDIHVQTSCFTAEVAIQKEEDIQLDEYDCGAIEKFDDEVEALAEDRRSLSNEIVKLNEELIEARTERDCAKQQLFDLTEKLHQQTFALEKECAISSRAHHNWELCEREARRLQDDLNCFRANTEAQVNALEEAITENSQRTVIRADDMGHRLDNLSSFFLAEKLHFNNIRKENDRLRDQTLELQRRLERERILRKEFSQLNDRSIMLESKTRELKSTFQMNNSGHVRSGECSISRNFSSPVHTIIHNNQDTDLDSDAYTDLSQVSVVRSNQDSGRMRRRNHSSKTTKMTNDPSYHIRHTERPSQKASVSSFPVITSPKRSQNFSVPTMRSKCSDGISVDASAFQPTHKIGDKPQTFNAEIEQESLFDRISELCRRNECQPFHLRTNYPVETQLCSPNEFLSVLQNVQHDRKMCSDSATNSVASSRYHTSVNVEVPLSSSVNIVPAGRSLRPKGLQSISEVLLTGSSGIVAAQEFDLAASTGIPPRCGSSLSKLSDDSSASSMHPSSQVKLHQQQNSHQNLINRSLSSTPSSQEYDHAALSSSASLCSETEQEDEDHGQFSSKPIKKAMAFEVKMNPPRAKRNFPPMLLAASGNQRLNVISDDLSTVKNGNSVFVLPSTSRKLAADSTSNRTAAPTNLFKTPSLRKSSSVVTKNGCLKAKTTQQWATPAAIAASITRRPLKETTGRTNQPF